MCWRLWHGSLSSRTRNSLQLGYTDWCISGTPGWIFFLCIASTDGYPQVGFNCTCLLYELKSYWINYMTAVSVLWNAQHGFEITSLDLSSASSKRASWYRNEETSSLSHILHLNMRMHLLGKYDPFMETINSNKLCHIIF